VDDEAPASASENRTHDAEENRAESILRLLQQNRPVSSDIAAQANIGIQGNSGRDGIEVARAVVRDFD